MEDTQFSDAPWTTFDIARDKWASESERQRQFVKSTEVGMAWTDERRTERSREMVIEGDPAKVVFK